MTDQYTPAAGGIPGLEYDHVNKALRFSGGVAVAGAVSAANIRLPRSRIVSQRVLGGTTATTGGPFTLHLCRRAPAHYDAVQLVIRGTAADAVNTFTASIAPSAKWRNGWEAVDAADAPVARTQFTWGSTNKADFWNPGGGALNTILNEASGSYAAGNLIENAAVSDWMFVRSLDRADDPSMPPLYHIRLCGTNAPAVNVPELSAASANPFSAADPEFYSGYWGADYVITEAAVAPGQSFAPCVEVRFLLRDKSIISIACAGDSIEQGWVQTAAVPQFGGLSNGWCRKFVAGLNANGVQASYFAMGLAGARSRVFHNMAFRMLHVPNVGVTHLFIKPWSVNENAGGITSAYAGISRTNQIIATCDAKGVIPIIIQPWAGQNITGAQGVAVAAYCDQLRAEGRNVFDARTIVGDPANIANIKAAYLTRNAGGGIVDQTHINEAGQDAVADFAMSQRAAWGIA